MLIIAHHCPPFIFGFQNQVKLNNPCLFSVSAAEGAGGGVGEAAYNSSQADQVPALTAGPEGKV